MAYLWATARAPHASRGAFETCRLSRLREIGQQMRKRGVESVWLWGAGSHTQWVLEHAEVGGIRVAGIVDDALAGERRFGFVVASPDSLKRGQTALISTDAFEDRIWRSSSSVRDAGVEVVRFYAD